MSVAAPGTRLGPYEITTRLGEGGMGEVWRATDSRLKREVAIKVLPAAFVADRERLQRFEREAQLLAQLHHPHIASIFGLEDAGGVPALVMELVEGPTLGECLARGPLPVDECVAIARQIAEALEAAHAKGIVHRDLKPANVKLAADGAVKVLDFGLAKAMDSAAGDGSAADEARSPALLAHSPTLMHSPTVTGPAGTQLGVILGTAGYMAPEQARGGAVDRRADIWAFGVVLYEMLTGRSLFGGESVVDTLSAVMRQEVDLARLPAGTPRVLRELLRRCLQRNLRQRLHDVADARIVLEELEKGDAREDGDASSSPATVVAPPRRVARTVLLATGLAVLALAAGVGLDRLLRAPAPKGPWSGARWALAIPDGLELSTNSAPQLALSDDGRLQAVVVIGADGRTQILLRSSDEVEPRLLPDTVGAQAPFFSPDGEWIAFFREQGLYKMPTRGGPPVLLADTGRSDTTRGGTWSRDGYVYFARGVSTGLSRVAATGGPIALATFPDDARDERTHRWPSALPDGSAVLFTCDTFASIEYYDDARIEAVRPATGERKVLVEGASMARYAAGKLVFARGGSLYAVDLDPRTLTVHGAPQAVVEGVATDVSSGAVEFAVSPSGAALWAPGGLSAQYQVVFVDASGTEKPANVTRAPYNEVQLSPDGTRAALVGGAGGEGDLWVADPVRGTTTRLTQGSPVFNPAWSPDGTQIAFLARMRVPGQGRHWQVGLAPADGSHAARVLHDDTNVLSLGGFTPDGAQLLVSRGSPASRTPGADAPMGSPTLFVLRIAGPGTLEPLASFAGERAGEPMVSPDGRWIAYTTVEGEHPNVFVRPFPAGDGRWQVSAPSGNEARWSADGTAMYYRSSANVLYRVAVDTSHGFAVGKPEAVVDRVSNAGSVHTYSVLRDGGIFTLRAPAGGGARRTLDLDLGFAGRLARVGRGEQVAP